jgi:hypothetical protein
MKPTQIVIEELDGDAFIRLTNKVLQKLEVGVGDSLYVVEAYVENYHTLVFSKTPSIPDRMDGVFESFGVQEAERLLPVQSLKAVIAKPVVPVRVEDMRPSWSTLSDSPKADEDFLQERPETGHGKYIVDLFGRPEAEDIELDPHRISGTETKE